MGRWEPDADGRLARAALDLYAERGFEQTTVADIARRAGVTERTFFRYFADKREVLFKRSAALQDVIVESIDLAPPAMSPIDTVGAAVTCAASMIQENREFAGQRAAVIAANPSLQERELLKLANLGTAAAEALRRRGVPDLTARLAAETGVTIFSAGFERWLSEPPALQFDQCITEALVELKAMTSQ